MGFKGKIPREGESGIDPWKTGFIQCEDVLSVIESSRNKVRLKVRLAQPCNFIASPRVSCLIFITNYCSVCVSWGAFADRDHFMELNSQLCFPGGSAIKNLPPVQEMWVQSLGREDPLEKEMAAHSSILSEKSHGQRGLAGYSPWGCKELNTAKQWQQSVTRLWKGCGRLQEWAPEWASKADFTAILWNWPSQHVSPATPKILGTHKTAGPMLAMAWNEVTVSTFVEHRVMPCQPLFTQANSVFSSTAFPPVWLSSEKKKIQIPKSETN